MLVHELATLKNILTKVSHNLKTKMSGDDEAGTDISSGNDKLKMFNVFLLGLCFFFVFAGFNTMGQTQVLLRV